MPSCGTNLFCVPRFLPCLLFFLVAPQMDQSSPLDVTIIDKDESSDQAYHVVDGFVIEDSKSPFPVSHMTSHVSHMVDFKGSSNIQQNGHLSFMPEDYGKEKPPPPKRTRNHGNSGTPNPPPLNGSSSQGSPSDEPLQPGQLRCEFCHMVGDRERFLPPSRRFCSLTCCKRYSAEKRYYPYGRDEQGIAKSIREGLLNPRSRHLRPGANKQVCVHVWVWMHVYGYGWMHACVGVDGLRLHIQCIAST